MCVEKHPCWFIKDEIIRQWHTEGMGLLAMIDITGTKKLLQRGATAEGQKIIREKLNGMRDAVMRWAEEEDRKGRPEYGILCMGDSVFIEQNK